MPGSRCLAVRRLRKPGSSMRSTPCGARKGGGTQLNIPRLIAMCQHWEATRQDWLQPPGFSPLTRVYPAQSNHRNPLPSLHTPYSGHFDPGYPQVCLQDIDNAHMQAKLPGSSMGLAGCLAALTQALLQVRSQPGKPKKLLGVEWPAGPSWSFLPGNSSGNWTGLGSSRPSQPFQ